MASEIDFVPDRLDRQPAVFLGLSDGELRLVAAANAGAWLPAGLLVGTAAGVWIAGFTAGVLLTAGGVWMSARALRRMKRGRPDGYHEDRIAAWLEDRGLKSRTMLRESAVWDVRRWRRPGGSS